jgi:hypothetical protein
LVKFRLNKRFAAFTIVLLILSLSAVAAKYQMIEKVASVYSGVRIPTGKNINEYDINAQLDPVEKILTATQKVKYVNTSDRSFNALYFHLYPNTFKSETTVPFEKGEMEFAYPGGFEEGNISISSVKKNNEVLTHLIMGKGDTILKVNLGKPLEVGESIVLEMAYTVKIPPSYGRFGYGQNTISIANWYPIAAVFDHRGWNLEPYYAIGDPFYSEVGNYRVAMALPTEYTLATTGNITKKENNDGKVVWTIDAKSVRDFAMITSDRFKVLEDEVDGVKIFSYYFEDQYGEIALDTAKDSIKIFNECFGKYPYEQFSVAAADFFIGGMEYPNLVFIDEGLYQEEQKDILEYVVAHEAAHQWWYGIVGNDEVNEPWLDEALTEYSTLLYYEKKYGKEVKEQIYKNMIVRYYDAYRNSDPNVNEAVYRSINKFKDSIEYQVMVYYKGAMFVEDLRNNLGDEQFFKVLKVYFDKYKFKNANTEGFINLCEQVTDKEWRQNFKEWLKYNKE